MYSDLEAKLHDVFWQAEAPDVELDLIVEHLDGREGRVFEIGCGSGRILLPLNERGFATDGNDVSADMLALLDERKGELDCQTFAGKVTEVDISAYRHFLVPAFTFMLMDEGEVEQTLRHIHANAAAEPSLYFTIFMPWAEICGELEEDTWYKDHEAENKDGSKANCRTKFTIDRTNQVLHRTHSYTYRTRDGKKKTQETEQRLRWFTFREMSLMLEHAGWQAEKIIYDLDPEVDSTNAHLYTFIAKKND